MLGRSRTLRPARRHLALAVSVVVAASLLVLAPAAEAASTVHRPKPATSVGHPMPGERFVLSGTLARSVARTVRLQRKVGNHWVHQASAHVGAAGRYRVVTTQPGYRTAWRVIARSVKVHGHRYKTQVSATRVLTRVAPQVSVSSTRAVRSGGRVSVTATAAPVRPGASLRIDIDSGSGWKTLTTGREGKAGRISSAWTSPANTRTSVRFRAVVGSVAGSGSATSPAVSSYVLPTTPVAVAAHRGWAARFAENSFHAFDGAMAQHADWIETDFHQTAPNATDIATGPCAGPIGTRFWVIVHDATYARTTNIAKVYPARANQDTTTFTCTETKALKVDTIRNPGLSDPGVPTLAEFVTWIGQFEQKYQYDGERFLLEYKGSNATAFADLYDQVKELAPSWIDAGSHDDKAVFSGFGYANAFAPLLDPTWGVGTSDGASLTNPRVTDGAELSAIVDQSSDPLPDQPVASNAHWVMVQYSTATLTKTAVAAARRRVGLIAGWTINDTTSMLKAAVTGADIIITDKVPEARSALLR